MHKRFRLLIGTGVVTVFVLTGTIYGFTYWQGWQGHNG